MERIKVTNGETAKEPAMAKETAVEMETAMHNEKENEDLDEDRQSMVQPILDEFAGLNLNQNHVAGGVMGNFKYEKKLAVPILATPLGKVTGEVPTVAKLPQVTVAKGGEPAQDGSCPVQDGSSPIQCGSLPTQNGGLPQNGGLHAQNEALPQNGAFPQNGDLTLAQVTNAEGGDSAPTICDTLTQNVAGEGEPIHKAAGPSAPPSDVAPNGKGKERAVPVTDLAPPQQPIVKKKNDPIEGLAPVKDIPREMFKHILTHIGKYDEYSFMTAWYPYWERILMPVLFAGFKGRVDYFDKDELKEWVGKNPDAWVAILLCPKPEDTLYSWDMNRKRRRFKEGEKAGEPDYHLHIAIRALCDKNGTLIDYMGSPEFQRQSKLPEMKFWPTDNVGIIVDMNEWVSRILNEPQTEDEKRNEKWDIGLMREPFCDPSLEEIELEIMWGEAPTRVRDVHKIQMVKGAEFITVGRFLFKLRMIRAATLRTDVLNALRVVCPGMRKRIHDIEATYRPVRYRDLWDVCAHRGMDYAGNNRFCLYWY